MAQDFQRVDPTPFESAERLPTAGNAAQAGQPRWLWPALALLLVTALLVIFLLPKLVDTAPVSSAGNGGTSTASSTSAGNGAAANSDSGSASAAKPGSAASPFADAVEAKARAAAQAVLEELLAVQEDLEARGAGDWAPEVTARIAAVATEGDGFYRERAFEAALEAYQRALDTARELEASIPERATQLREETTAAIEALDPERASASYARAERLQPGAEELLELADRLEVLPEVVSAAASAEAAEDASDLAEALAALDRAAGLDPAHEMIARARARVADALTAQRFNQAMSDGYAALEARRFDAATAQFERAAKLRPEAAEAAAALREVSLARTAAQLRALKDRGEEAVSDEDWPAAIKAFEEALAVDGSLRFAREGLALARPRAALQKDMQAILDDPGRLVEDAILAEAQKTLERAREVQAPGPKLAARIEAVASTVAAASQPVTVTLRSDGETAVTVYKVARLGQFETRQLSLRPGRYTAVGSRRGFRDVRNEFTVTPDGLANPVFIACSEAI